MSVYYSFIAGLPDLEFAPEANFELPDDFMAKLEEQLPPEELALARLLWLQKFQQGITQLLSGRNKLVEHVSGFETEAFDSGHESFHQLPVYLQKLTVWKESQKEQPSEMLIAQKLQYFYYRQLLSSGNRFLQHWGELELNRLNFLAAHRSEKLSAKKENQLIKGNDYYELLMEFPAGHKITHTEFLAANQLETITAKSNYLERETEMDRLRWDCIDEINRFEYFTIDVILGFLQKLLLLERWKNIYNPEKPVDPVETAEKLIADKQI